jgi:hypothetical protein
MELELWRRSEGSGAGNASFALYVTFHIRTSFDLSHEFTYFCVQSCEEPFENPSFFERDAKPYCEPCFSIILRNEL